MTQNPVTEDLPAVLHPTFWVLQTLLRSTASSCSWLASSPGSWVDSHRYLWVLHLVFIEVAVVNETGIAPRTRKQSVAVYARYSSDRQDARSIDDQLRRCREFASARGWQVLAEYKDAAQSGATLDRADMQRLLADVKRRGGAPFSAVLLDDLSRLSRDLGDTWRIVFEDLASTNVTVIDCTTGMASDGAGARVTFGAMALVNDTFLQLVRSETHRGLEGRAIKGFWTGGRVYGYSTVQEPNPPDPEHPRTIVVVNEEQAAVVRRIFELASRGTGFAKIADTLNQGGIPAPYDGVVGKKRGRGWSQSTIRAMLMNERYCGTFVWNKRKFSRAQGRHSRRAILRPRDEWKVTQRPDLAIIASEVWSLVQARFKAPDGSRLKRGRPLGASKRYVHLLSGVLRCGICTAPMTITGTSTKNRVRYFTFGCAAYHSRGRAICANSLTVSEKKVNEAVLGALRNTLLRPEVLQHFIKAFNERLITARKAMPSEAKALEESIQRAEARVRNITEAVAQAGWSATLGDRLREEEGRLQVLRNEEAFQGQSVAQTKSLPHPNLITGYVTDLLATVEANPEEGRELLRQRLGAVQLTPKGEGPNRAYHATGAFNLSVFLGKDDNRPENSVAGAGFEPATFGL